MAHHRDHRRALDEVSLVVLLLDRGLDLLLGGGDDLDLAVELLRDRLDGLVGECLGEGRHLALLHQRLDHLGAGQAQALGDLTDGGAGVDLDRRLLLRLLQLLVAWLLPQRAAPAGPPAAPAAARWAGRRLSLGDVVAPRGLRIDHDASAALWRALARGAVAGAGSVGALRSRGLRAGSLGSVIRLRGCLLGCGLGGGSRGRSAVSGALQRRQRIRLLDTRLRGLGLDAGGLELGQELLARQALGLGDLVYSLLRHYSVVRSSLAVTVSAWGSPPSSDASAPSAAGSSSASATGASSA